MGTHFLFIFVCFLLDSLLATLFPASFDIHQMIFIPCLGFCAMVLTIRKFNKIDCYLTTFICGMLYDYFYTNTFLLYAFVFTFIAFLIRLWSKHMMDTTLELSLLSISTIFVKELVVYLIMLIGQSTTLSLQEWFVNRMFLTFVVNSILVLGVIFCIKLKEDYLEFKDLKLRREEKVLWFKLSSRQ